MAAGLGFKTFNTGDVLSAADVNGYLMQGVLVFADATARNAAITSPQEGQFAYLKDTNVTTYYTGSSWANLDTTGMTNPMTTTGDTIYSSSGSTPARLGIGTAGQVLTVNAGATAPEWKTPAAGGGGKVLQVVQATYSTAKTIASTTFTDTDLTASITPTASTSKVLVLVHQTFYHSRSTAQETGIAIKLVRGSTDILTIQGSGSDRASYLYANGGVNVGRDVGGILPLAYLDSPATTSATTYKTQGRVATTADSGTSTYQAGSTTSTILLLEIGA